MAQPFENLPLILARRQAEMVRLVNGMVQKAVFEGGAYLVKETPVKRGVARSNWVASKNQRFSAVIPAYSPYPSFDWAPAPPGMKFESANALAAVAQHTATSSTFDARRDKEIIIQNNTPYISDLNQGRSIQSAAGWFNKCADIAKAGIQGMWRLKK